MKIILLFTIIFLLLAAFAIITSGSGEEEQTEVCFFTLFIDTLLGMTLHVLSSYVCKDLSLAYEMILRSLDLLLRKNCEWKNVSEIILHKYYKQIRRVS